MEVDNEGYRVIRFLECAPMGVSVWINREAEGRERVNGLVFREDIYQEREGGLQLGG